MLKLVDTSSCSIQSKRFSPSETSAPSLKLVVSNPLPVQKTLPLQKTNSNMGFTAELRNKGPYLYIMTIKDSFHYLSNELTLEIEEIKKNDYRIVICHFPDITDGQLEDFVEENDTLYGIIMIQFQMKILEQLLLFCPKYNASRLVIYTDDLQAKDLEIYRDFLIYEDQTLTQNAEQTEMVISSDQKTFDAWIDFMNQTTLMFRQTLWKDQRTNLAIRH